jgi:hypothetical protein
MLYVQVFQVEGAANFPFDMLRYDHCYPDSSEDATNLDRDDRPFTESRRTVKLRRIVQSKADAPTEARWRSFGWKVVPNSVHTCKL